MPSLKIPAKHKQQTVPHGPPQPPLEELPGETVTPEMVGDKGIDPFGRDEFSLDQKVAATKAIMTAYERHRLQPVYPQLWCPPGLYLFSGDMGDGKTLIAVAIAKIFMICGWPAYSANAGVGFGKSLSEKQTFQFHDVVTRGSVLVADELHAIYGRAAGMSVRGRTMAQGTAGFRKEMIWALGATSREWMIGGDLKAAIRGIGYPEKTHPQTRMIAPPWCYKAVKWHYPDPFRGKQYRETIDPELRHREATAAWTQVLHPHDLYEAGKLYHSWEKIITDFGGNLSAAKMRENSAGEDQAAAALPGHQQITDREIGLTLLRWFGEGRFDANIQAYNDAVSAGQKGNRGEAQISFNELGHMFWVETMSEVGPVRLKNGLAAIGARASTRNVNIRALAEAFEDHSDATQGSGA